MSDTGFTASAPGEWELPSAKELIEMLPQYDIVDFLGKGGMGAVFKGRQAKLDRDVAIKLLFRSAVESDEEMKFSQRFQLEAKAMAKLDHPNIVSVFDFGETHDGQLYLVMEFIDGMDIQQYIAHHGGCLPQEHALSITAHVLDALGYAHSHGIVHRDIKPANILLNHEGRVKIADFGLAKTFGGGESDPGLTMTNMSVGTPDFVAPEALQPGKVVDHRADLYAVGVMLYQMLTGSMPRGIFKMPSVLIPELDERLDTIIEKAMEADPEHRYPSASDVRKDLDKIISRPISKLETEDEESVSQQSDMPIGGDIDSKPSASFLRRLMVPLILCAGIIVLSFTGAGYLFKIVNSGESGDQIPTETRLSDLDVDKSSILGSSSMKYPYVNSLGMRFVPVPVIKENEKGAVVFFSAWETRVQDYRSFVESYSGRHWNRPKYEQGMDHPAVHLRWDDAVAFCEWLTREERNKGYLESDLVYRLPTDYEWSCAMGIEPSDKLDIPPLKKSGMSKKYPWGSVFPPDKVWGNYYGEEATDALNNNWEPIKDYNDGFVYTAPVASFLSNKHGLYDLSGNVWEWCQDIATESPSDTRRVTRGGSYTRNIEQSLRTSARHGIDHHLDYSDIGFRAVIAKEDTGK